MKWMHFASKTIWWTQSPYLPKWRDNIYEFHSPDWLIQMLCWTLKPTNLLYTSSHRGTSEWNQLWLSWRLLMFSCPHFRTCGETQSLWNKRTALRCIGSLSPSFHRKDHHSAWIRKRGWLICSCCRTKAARMKYDSRFLSCICQQFSKQLFDRFHSSWTPLDRGRFSPKQSCGFLLNHILRQFSPSKSLAGL
jgi:hypothetical protein